MAWIVPALAVALGAPPVPAMAREGTPAGAARGAAAGPGSKGHGKMAFVLTTGLEDIQAVGMAINHARIAQQSGYLDERTLAWLGRSRRHSRHHEWYPESGEAMIRISSIHRMPRLLKPDRIRQQAPFNYRNVQE